MVLLCQRSFVESREVFKQVLSHFVGILWLVVVAAVVVVVVVVLVVVQRRASKDLSWRVTLFICTKWGRISLGVG